MGVAKGKQDFSSYRFTCLNNNYLIIYTTVSPFSESALQRLRLTSLIVNLKLQLLRHLFPLICFTECLFKGCGNVEGAYSRKRRERVFITKDAVSGRG